MLVVQTHIVAGMREMAGLQAQVLSLYKKTCPRVRSIKPTSWLHPTAKCGH